MSWVFSPPPTEIEIDGVIYQLNTDWESCLWTWRAYQAFDAGELTEKGYAAVIADKMFLEPKPDIFNNRALQFAGEYLSYFSDKDKSQKSNIPPVDIEQDAEYIYRAFTSMGVNLRKQRIDYEEFQARLPEIPEGCSYAQIMHLRHLWYNERSKMTKEEKKAMERIGRDKVLVRNRKVEKEKQENEDVFTAMKNKKRAEQGLPPV